MVVVDVEPASVLSGPNGVLPTTGTITFGVQVPRKFAVDGPNLPEFLAIRMPKVEDVPLEIVDGPTLVQQ